MRLKRNVERVLIIVEVAIPVLVASATSQVSNLVLLSLVAIEALNTRVLLKYSRIVNGE